MYSKQTTCQCRVYCSASPTTTTGLFSASCVVVSGSVTISSPLCGSSETIIIVIKQVLFNLASSEPLTTDSCLCQMEHWAVVVLLLLAGDSSRVLREVKLNTHYNFLSFAIEPTTAEAVGRQFVPLLRLLVISYGHRLRWVDVQIVRERRKY